ncbi:MAG: YwiC-like family protein [bacterium JZ-2024 1]
MRFQRLFRRPIALPVEHGAWVFLLSPLVIGIFAGGRWHPDLVTLIIGALAGFLLRHPVTLAVKIWSGRRPRDDLPVVQFWMLVYASVVVIAGIVIFVRGFAILFLLALPSLPIFVWYLYLVFRRDERRQMGLEIVASGACALSAPAALWMARGSPDPQGWTLFVLTWLQSAASIVHAYMRLSQRGLSTVPPLPQRFKIGSRALLYVTFNLFAVSLFSALGFLPPLIFVPYAVQGLETLHGVLKPAIGVRPTSIGIRQLAVSTLFTILFIIFWR